MSYIIELRKLQNNYYHPSFNLIKNNNSISVGRSWDDSNRYLDRYGPINVGGCEGCTDFAQ